MKDLINRKAQQRGAESTCDRLNKRHSDSSGRREVHNRSSEMDAKSEAVLYHAVLLVRY